MFPGLHADLDHSVLVGMQSIHDTLNEGGATLHTFDRFVEGPSQDFPCVYQSHYPFCQLSLEEK